MGKAVLPQRCIAYLFISLMLCHISQAVLGGHVMHTRLVNVVGLSQVLGHLVERANDLWIDGLQQRQNLMAQFVATIMCIGIGTVGYISLGGLVEIL